MKTKDLVVNETYTHENGKQYQYKGTSGAFADKPYIFVRDGAITFYPKSFVDKLKTKSKNNIGK